ncbi:influenza virus NS1A-binding protein homolog isoform X1 [Arctopsyche grandis]|uniref:influenza virus NS1A-binding protein homolog isoform X1 n=1 Tax=Arctopsyche grandis TaxID=121162 RepID=UPI00406D816E
MENHTVAGGVASGANGSNGVVGPGDLVFDDEDLVPAAMRALNMMRKNKHFCDVVLHTGSAEVPAHRAVLAAASPYLFELFTTDQDRSGLGAIELPLSYKLSGHCEQRALLSLVDYAYTGKLCVPAHHVLSVYMCAWQLRMDSVVTRCGLFLAGSWLSKETCLSVRALPGLTGEARAMVDKYMADNFSSIYKSSLLSSLPLVQVEVLYTSRKDMDQTEHAALADLMLNWLKDQITDDKVPVSALCGRTHLLYIAGGGELKDCAALPPAHSDTPLIQDYRRMLLKCPPSKSGKRNGNGVTNGASSNGTSSTRISTFYLRDILERAHRQPGDDWAIIVCETLAGHTFLSLSTLDGHLALISASLRLNESPLPSPGAIPPAITNNHFTNWTPGTAQPLAQLERPRCAYGMAVLEGKIIVCGGYDRVECLNSVEIYDPEKNRWTNLNDMRQQRGRFNIAQVGNRVYAIGGSDGHVELDSVEMYQAPVDEGDSSRSMTASLESQSGSIDLSASSSIEDHHVTFATNTHNGTSATQNGTALPNALNGTQKKKAWTKRARLPLARSYAAVCGGPDGKVFCIGGWAAQPGIRDCHVYSTDEDVWNEMSPLNTGRYQAGACMWGGALWVVGGCDAWHCLSTTEVHNDPTSSNPGSWHFGPSLSVARRGCGVAVWGSRLAVAGGSDGQNSLRSVEFLSVGGTWEPGPPMREKRAGVSLAALNDRLYAVGGFSGKLFLSTMEYLVEGSDEWTSLTIPLPAQITPHENGRGPSPGKQEQDKPPTEALSKLNVSSNKESSPAENEVVREEELSAKPTSILCE